MQTLSSDEIYHLMDLLVMNTNNTLNMPIFSDEHKKESIKFDNDLHAKLRTIAEIKEEQENER